jgi:hypothetical protein
MFIIRPKTMIVVAIPFAHVESLFCEHNKIILRTISGNEWELVGAHDGLYDDMVEKLEKYWETAIASMKSEVK